VQSKKTSGIARNFLGEGQQNSGDLGKEVSQWDPGQSHGGEVWGKALQKLTASL